MISILSNSKRPLLVLGNGIRLSHNGASIEKIIKLSQKIKIPIVSTYLGVDFFDNTNDFYFGPIGIKASRAANLITGNSDLIICIGTRLATSVIGFEYELFAPNSKKIIVDIDTIKHQKSTIQPDLLIESDAYAFLKILEEKMPNLN